MNRRKERKVVWNSTDLLITDRTIQTYTYNICYVVELSSLQKREVRRITSKVDDEPVKEGQRYCIVCKN